MQLKDSHSRIPDSLSLSGTQDDLRHRRLDDAHVEALSVPLGGVSFLKSIDLSFNEISDAGAARIASFLKSNRHVHTLNLSSNNIKSAGAKALADVLIHDESVANLNLAHNELGTDGGIAIANMLQVNTALHTLNLTSTSQTATSLTALFIVLLNHPTLRDIDVSDNASQTHRLTQTLDRDVMLHVARAMRSEENALETLGIGKMGITDWICVEVIAGAVKSSLGLQVLNLRA
ncbi:hypothetical protein DFJ73DRAFT_34955 [Zopfochytrium polystomum]|nr:hypothetical protein DFJ73DRAFT_34955 [Zopfochytrium polystomum]